MHPLLILSQFKLYIFGVGRVIVAG